MFIERNIKMTNENIEIVEDDAINFGDQSMGLADFCNVDVSEIEANEGYDILPAGAYVMHTDSIKVNTVTRRNRDTNEEFKVPNVSMMFVIDEVVATVNYDGDEGKLIGRKHSEFVALPTFDAEQFAKAVGRLKAMASRIAGREKDYKYASIPAILEDIAGKSFNVKIKHGSYTNKDGEKVKTEDFDLKSIKPAE